MSRGYGKVQNGCLIAIWHAEQAGEMPSTYDIAAAVFRTEVNDDGYHLSDAQHVAVKRALGGLQRQGKVIGIPQRFCGVDVSDDRRSNYRYYWMTEKRAQEWVSEQSKDHPMAVTRFRDKMRAIGMNVDAENKPEAENERRTKAAALSER
jgi:hypothetical protein